MEKKDGLALSHFLFPHLHPPSNTHNSAPPFLIPPLHPLLSLSLSLTNSSQDSPSSRRQEALKRSKARPWAVQHSGNTVSLSAPQPHFPESCRIAAGLHSAGFLNALGFDFDISDPPSTSSKREWDSTGGGGVYKRQKKIEKRQKKKKPMRNKENVRSMR